MESNQSQHELVYSQSRSRSKDMVPLRPIVVKRVGECQIFKRRLFVRNKDGIIVWQADVDKYCYRDESTNKLHFCSCAIEGGVVIIRDHLEEVVEAYKLKDGETVETVY